MWARESECERLITEWFAAKINGPEHLPGVPVGLIHACVLNRGPVEIIEFLSVLVDINARDAYDHTALMYATKLHWGSLNTNVPVIEKLSALGSNKDLVDKHGCTAYGHYMLHVRASNDFRATLVYKWPKCVPDPVISRFLLPSEGPMQADQLSMDDHDYDDGDGKYKGNYYLDSKLDRAYYDNTLSTVPLVAWYYCEEGQVCWD